MKKFFITCMVMSAVVALNAQDDTSATRNRLEVRKRILAEREGRIAAGKTATAAKQEKKAGSVEQVKGKEIIVKHANPEKPFFMGDRLHVVVNGESITLEVTFPMQTSSKCRIDAGSAGKAALITKGMPVYTGEKAPEVKEEKVEERVPARRLRGPNN